MKKFKCLLFDIYSSAQRFLYKSKNDSVASDAELKEAELVARATAQAAEQLHAKEHDLKIDVEAADEAKVEAEAAQQELEDMLKKTQTKK